MDDEEFENPDLIIPPNIKIIDPETLSDEEKKELQRIIEETGDEPSTDDMPPELNAIKKLQRQAGDAARAKASAKAKAKQNWKTNEVAKNKTATRKPRKARSAGKGME